MSRRYGYTDVRKGGNDSIEVNLEFKFPVRTTRIEDEKGQVKQL